MVTSGWAAWIRSSPSGAAMMPISVIAVAPQAFPIVGTPTAWTPGTAGLVRGDAVMITENTLEELKAKYTGKLKGASRRYIMTAIEASLKRLKTDWIDLYQVHMVDPLTPMDETLRALDDLVTQGKVRYLGLSTLALGFGQWAQQIGMAWLAYDLTGSAVQLGAISVFRAGVGTITAPLGELDATSVAVEEVGEDGRATPVETIRMTTPADRGMAYLLRADLERCGLLARVARVA